MRKLTLEEWEKKYIRGPVEQFDQKYTMFNRPGWDPEVRDLTDDWSFTGAAREKPGYRSLDQALSRASSRATQLVLFNTSKPNRSPVSTAIREAMASSFPRSRNARPRPEARAKVAVDDSAAMTRHIKKVARYFGADLVGVCRLDPRWVYSHTYEGLAANETGGSADGGNGSMPQEIPAGFQYAVVMGFEEEYDLMRYSPTHIADAATGMGYSRMAIANAHLSAFIRNLGHRAIDCSTNDVALSIPLAMQAGLGDQGRNGLLITPQFGPRQRLSKVLTDLPLVPDSPIEFGVTEFCQACKKCADMCPSRSITTADRTAEPHGASSVGGELKWRIDPVSCRIFWARGNKSCTICIACCPYNKPSTPFHRAVGWLADNARWADSFFVWGDNLLGYGKPKKADDFWEEWRPLRH